MRNLFLPLLILASLIPGARAEKYALLVGVGGYERVSWRLEGPPNDVAAMKSLLRAKWGFSEQNIKDLVDARATRTATLNALAALVANMKPGDVGFFYFSGHGTSFFDTKALRDKAAVFDPNSGALVPYDGKIGTATEVYGSLIVGSRDIRPLLAKVPSGASMFVVFDSCYSGGSARSLVELPTRGIPPSEFAGKAVSDDDLAAFGVASVKPTTKPILRMEATANDAWPYSNVLYISAASKMEQAIDINQQLLREHPTVDNRPHGALTNGLIAALNGPADTNHDGTITYEELYRYVSTRVEGEFNHRPQFRTPGPAMASAPVLGQFQAPRTNDTTRNDASTNDAKVRVRLEGVPENLARQISSLPDVTVSAGPFDLLVRPNRNAGSGFDLFHSSYDRIQYFSREESGDLVNRIALHRNSRQLVQLAYAKQAFNVAIDLARVNGKAGEAEFYLNDRVQVTVTAEKPCYAIAFDVDTSGQINLLYASEKQLQPRQATPLGQPLRVANPVGLEYLKVIAFEQKPADFDYWKSRFGDSISPSSPDFARLMKFLADPAGRPAQAVTKFVTAKPPSSGANAN